MSRYSVAEASAHLDQLLDEAAAGEAVVIARPIGDVVLSLAPVTVDGPTSPHDLTWLRGARVSLPAGAKLLDAVAIMRDLRDGDRY